MAGVKPVEIDLINLTIPAAIFAYPLTFILVDILNEFYGLKMARRAIFLTFRSNICFVFLLWVTTIMPSLDEWDMSYAYNKFVSDITSVLIASSVSYLISENINSYLLCKIKYLTNSKFLYIRVITSTAAAAAVDSVLFITIAFYGVFDQIIIERMIIAQFIIKMIYAIIGVIPIYGSRCLFNKYIHPQEKRKDIAYGS